ncbi:hypothetical protein L1887_30832 [Cichorium endivia]|nr:hypothetical protein L1887_30832 [Cichorium endivia]
MSISKIHRQMAEAKQLVLVVEGTDALRPHWPTIVSNYLEKVIRSYCAFLITRSSWTKNVNTFMEWVQSVNFTGVTLFGAAATAEGLGEALMMFPYVNGFHPDCVQKHCILVAASNPCSVPTPVYTRPRYQPPYYTIMKPGTILCDAETVAKSFYTISVSLSVISPCRRNIPKLEAIYYAAKSHLPKTGRNIRNVTNPENLVLISEHFMEARLALGQPVVTKVPPNKSPVAVDITEDSSPDS